MDVLFLKTVSLFTAAAEESVRRRAHNVSEDDVPGALRIRRLLFKGARPAATKLRPIAKLRPSMKRETNMAQLELGVFDYLVI